MDQATLTNIVYVIAAVLFIYDLGGRLVARLVDGFRGAGRHEESWDTTDERGRRVAPGIYFARLETRGGTSGRRVVVLR